MGLKLADRRSPLVEATLATTSITHSKLQLKRQRSSCTVGNVGASFRQQRGMRGIKKRQHLWICCIDFDTQTIHCESDDVKCDAKLMEYSSKAALIYFF